LIFRIRLVAQQPRNAWTGGFSNVPEPHVTVHLKKGNLTANIEMLKGVWKSTFPDQDFECHFLDESIANQYKSEQMTANLIQLASFFSIFISCIGLFGIITLVVLQRTKEIGIRKILGASVIDIVVLLSKNFMRLVIISALLAFPIAWWFMRQWLQGFAFKVHLMWWVFIIAGISAALVALVTLCTQALKIAMANPVKSLRTE
jgi:putative ABC transport system permease protein